MNTSKTTNTKEQTNNSFKREDTNMFKFKNIFKVTLVALCGMLMFISCDDINSSTEKEPPAEKAITAQQMQNDKNPFDNEGVMHNKFLDYIGKEMADDTTRSIDRLNMIIERFYTQNNMEFTREDMQMYSTVFDVFKELNIGGPVQEYPFVELAESLCSQYPEVCDLLSPTGPYNPYEAPSDILQENEETTSTERTLKFIDSTKEIETKLMRDKTLEDLQKNAILAKLSVARHSAGYWHNASYIQKGDNPYFEDWLDVQKLACGTCDVIQTDAAGAAIGGLFGGLPGAGIVGGVASAAAVVEIWFW